MKSNPHVCILMATYNGAAHLQAQLDSFLAQGFSNWSLLVSDDQSSDASQNIIRKFAAENPSHEVQLLEGPGQGASAVNFLSLIERCPAGEPRFLAFSDQDDVWMPDRLSRAVAQLVEGCPDEQPGIYAGRTMLVTNDLEEICLSRRHPKAPSFGNALVQNILAGNTIVLNPAAATLAQRCAPAAAQHPAAPYHDWWLYQLMTGAGAHVCLDDKPCLKYRQHENNVLGANRGLRHAIRRLSLVFKHQYADWIDRNLTALDRARDCLTDDAKRQLDGFLAFRAARGGSQHSFTVLRQLGISRQTKAGNLMLRLAILARRF